MGTRLAQIIRVVGIGEVCGPPVQGALEGGGGRLGWANVEDERGLSAVLGLIANGLF